MSTEFAHIHMPWHMYPNDEIWWGLDGEESPNFHDIRYRNDGRAAVLEFHEDTYFRTDFKSPVGLYYWLRTSPETMGYKLQREQDKKLQRMRVLEKAVDRWRDEQRREREEELQERETELLDTLTNLADDWMKMKNSPLGFEPYHAINDLVHSLENEVKEKRNENTGHEKGEKGKGKVKTDPQLLATLKDIVDHWVKEDKDERNPRRRLIILEDLGGEWVEMLGSYLRIPRDFFELHWATPEDHSLGIARVPLGQSPFENFILSYTQDHPDIKIPYADGFDYRIDCCAIRPIIFDSKSRAITTEQLISYWGSKDEDGSWTAVLLVDPPLDKQYLSRPEESKLGKSNEKMKMKMKKKSQWEPKLCQDSLDDSPRYSLKLSKPLKTFSDSPERPQSAADNVHLKRYSSIFDELCEGDQGLAADDYAYPINSTYRCRRLVLQKTAVSMLSVFLKTYRMKIETSTGKNVAEFGADSYADGAWLSKWRGKQFLELWTQQEDIQLVRLKLRRTINILARVRGASSTYREQEEIDFQEWNDLELQGENTYQMIKRCTDSYLQTVSAGEAQVANNQARSVGALTALATFALPFGVVAAVFVIPDSSSPGKIGFWIYWVFAVPLAVLIVILLLSPIGRVGFTFIQRLFAPIGTWFQEKVWKRYGESVMGLLPLFIRYDEEDRHRKELESGKFMDVSWSDLDSNDSINDPRVIPSSRAILESSTRSRFIIRDPRVVRSLPTSVERLGMDIGDMGLGQLRRGPRSLKYVKSDASFLV